jgi:lipopolysaccharide export system protein LptA
MKRFTGIPRRIGIGTACLGAAWIFLTGVCSIGQDADLLRGPIRGGFSVAEADQETGRRKYALWGESATPLTSSLWEIQSPRLELYGADDTTNLVFMPARCLYHREDQRITSSETLRMWTGDGYLRMQGEGFALDLEARRLWVSNRVEAVMNKMLFREAGQAVSARAGEGGAILVRSERLEYGNDRVEFLGGVRAEDAEDRMDCEQLVVDLVPQSSDVRLLIAEGAVRFAATDIQVEAERAAYAPASGRLQLTGNPRWLFRQRPGRAREVELDRERQAFSATGDVQMELPAEALALPELRMGQSPAPRAKPGDEPVHVRAERMDAGPEAGETNRHTVVLRGEVAIEQGDVRLRCREFLLRTEGQEHRAQRAEAEGAVRIDRGSEWMSCDRAEYDAAGAYAQFTGAVKWEGDKRSGSANRVWLDLAEDHHWADGGVRMRFEQENEFLGAWLAPEADSKAPTIAGETEVAEPTDIECDRFEYRGGRTTGAVPSADYLGNVTVRQGERLNMTCGTLRAEFRPETNAVQSVVAEERVELRSAEEGGYRLARGDRMIYSAAEEVVRLTGRDGVDFFVIGPSGVSRGRGRQAVYHRTTDRLVLAGDPEITTPDGELMGSEVRLDRAEGVLSAAGPWRIRLPLGDVELPQLPGP